MTQSSHGSSRPPAPTRVAWWNDQRIRAIFYQVAVLGVVAAVVAYLVSNTLTNLAARQIATGFGFLGREAGFGISESPIPYSPADTYLHASRSASSIRWSSPSSASFLRPSSASSSASRGCRATGSSPGSPASTSKGCAIFPSFAAVLLVLADHRGAARAAAGAEPAAGRISLRPRPRGCRPRCRIRRTCGWRWRSFSA